MVLAPDEDSIRYLELSSQVLKAFKSILFKSKLKSYKLVLKEAMNMIKVRTKLKRNDCVLRIKLGKLKIVVGD